MEDDDFVMLYSQTHAPSLTVEGSAKTAKTFNDPIHGHFRLGGATIAVVDTPEFQRLRWLKQLGLTYYVFPGASHNRFEHSLGVAHLGAKWARGLQQQDPGLDIDATDIALVELAGGLGGGSMQRGGGQAGARPLARCPAGRALVMLGE
jgi:hypothetical protein